MPQPDSGFLLENLMDNVPDAIYFKDRNSRFVMINKACAQKHGWESPEAILGKTDFDLFSREHAEQAFADEQKIIGTGEPLHGIEEKETWPDGSVSWVSTTKMPLKDADGEIVGTFGISRDITRHKEAGLRAKRYAEEVRRIKEEMEEDFRMAGELQKTFFPSSYPAFPEGAAPGGGRVEFLHDFRACGDVGSDYCSVHRISRTEAGIFLCDVQGVGIRSALGTALVRGIVQEIAPLGLEPGAYLSRMNELLVPLVRKEELLLGVTACYLALDTVSGEVRFANAGHPSPLLLRKNGSVERVCENPADCCGSALATRLGIAYCSIGFYVGPGDGVVLYTDGLCSVENALGEPYGETRMFDSAQGQASGPLADVFRGLEDGACAFARNGTFTDDVCLVGFRLRPA